MRVRLSLFFLFTIVVAMASLEAKPVKVITFNIRYATAKDGDHDWTKRKDALLQWVKAQDPDILLLQEAQRSQIDAFEQVLPDYQYTSVGRVRGLADGIQVPIFWKRRFVLAASETLWFSDTPEVPGSKGWGNDQPRNFAVVRLLDKESDYRALRVVNLHLDHISQPSREKSIRLLERRLNWADNPEPLIMGGDFNMRPNNTGILWLTGKIEKDGPRMPLVDSWQGRPGRESFNGFGSAKNTPRIDYILTTPKVRVVSVEIDHTRRDGGYLSDHYPVVLTCDW